MTELQEFGRREAHLSNESSDSWTIHGVAIGAGDVSHGSSGVKKYWPADELKNAADTLEGRNLVENHNTSTRGVVGRVTKAGYKEGTGVLYEAELFDEELAKKIKNNLLEVSIRGYHIDVDEMEENDDGAKIVEGIKFDNLSIVPKGAAPSNTLEMGESSELSLEELNEYVDSLEPAILAEYAPADWVMWDDGRGIILLVEDGEAEVDLYEEQDGTYRSTGETAMVALDDLESWDVDEDNVGKREKDSAENAEEELVAQGDKVQWDSAGGLAKGVVIDRQTEGCFGDRIDGDVKVCADEDDPVLLINVVQESDGGYEKSGTMVAHKESTVEQTDFSLSEHNTPEWTEGDLVQWQVEPDLFGKIVHVDESRQIVMVDIHETDDDGEFRSTGFTISAGYSDLMPMESDLSSSEMADMLREVEARAEAAYELSDNSFISKDRWTRARVSAFIERLTGAADTSSYTQDDDLIDELSVDEGSEETSIALLSDYDWIWFDDDERLTEDEELASMDELDEVYDEWQSAVNMTADELREWSGNPCSRQASVDPEAVIERNLRLLETNKDEWTTDDIADAKRTISFVARMSDGANEPESPRDGPYGCPSEWAISLLNWAYNPFDSVPDTPSDNELDAVEELIDYDYHKPSYDGTTEGEWNSPDMEDFDTDDLSDIADHFLISTTGFPPENFTDLKLPVVEPSGELSLSALRAVKGGRGVSAVEDLSSDMEEKIIRDVNQMAADEFDKNWGEEEMAMDIPDDHMFEEKADAESKAEDLGISGAHEMGGMWVPGASHEEYMDAVSSNSMHMDDDEEENSLLSSDDVMVRSGDELHDGRLSGVSEMDSITTITTIMTDVNDELVEELGELEEPMALEAEEFEELQAKAEKYEDISDDLSELRERTEVLDEVDRSLVDELSDADDPMVVESSRYEQLSDEAEEVKSIYAANLAEEVGVFESDELMEKWSIEELRAKHEEHIGDFEEELSPSPKSTDPSEEELESRAGTNDDPAELEKNEEVENKQAELKDKLGVGN